MRVERVIGVVVLLLSAVSVFSLNTNDSILSTTDSILNPTDSILITIDTAYIAPDDSLQSETLAADVKRATIYQGTTVKLDVGATAVIIGMNRGRIQHYEMAVNVRLKNRFYPTFEIGYAGTSGAGPGNSLGAPVTYNDTIFYQGQGGFFRVGCDINPLKKHPESPHALLIGIRLGAAVQDYIQNTVVSETGTLSSDTDFRLTTSGVRGDCWGEIVAGCQVEMCKVGNTAFYMGWMFRFKVLFTRTLTAGMKAKVGEVADTTPYMPTYIPGYGNRDNIGWGLSYHLAWRF